MVMTRSKDDPKDLYNLLWAKDERKELDRQFKNVRSNFKIAIVVDMWLTGFEFHVWIQSISTNLFKTHVNLEHFTCQ